MKREFLSKILVVLIMICIVYFAIYYVQGRQQDNSAQIYWSIVQSQLTRIEYNSITGVHVITVQRENDLENLFVNVHKRLTYTGKENDEQGWIFRVTFNCAEPEQENRIVFVLTEEEVFLNDDAYIVEEFIDYPSVLEKMYEIYIDLCKKYERLP